MGYTISNISQGGVAERNGGLRVGDKVISIDGVNIEEISHVFTTGNAVKLIVRTKNSPKNLWLPTE